MGNELKAIEINDEEIRVGNYMALFGGKDLTGEHFTDATDFESEYTKTGMLYVDWEHGMNYDDPESPQRDDILGYVDWKTAKKDERGLWVERVLSRRNEYMQYLETLIEEGMIGTSSEAVGGKVRKTSDGEIQIWPLKRDALTVTPAEPRMMSENAISAIKALSEFQPHLKALLKDGATVDEGDDDGEIEEISTKETAHAERRTNTMSLTPEQVAEVDARVKAYIDQHEIREAPIEEAQGDKFSEQLEILTDLIKNSPNLRGDYVAPDSEEDHENVKSFGDFLVAVRQNNTKRLETVYKTALTGETGAQGGYTIPTEYGSLIEGRANELSVLRRAGATVVPMTSRTRDIPIGDFETAPSAGDTAYAFGVVARWTEEAASISESEPRFKLMNLIAHKLSAYSLASNEVREDSNENVDGLVAMAFSRAIAAQENYQFFRGNGVGKPRGILESGAWSAQTRSAASTVALGDLAIMMSAFLPSSLDSGSYAWFYNPAVLQELVALVSNPLAWMDNLQGARVPIQLMGGPAFVTGALPGLNTAGDIMLVDPQYYYIGDRTGIDIAISEHYKFVNDQMTWRVRKRLDGQPILDSTVTLENASTTVSAYVGLAAG